MSQGGLYDGPGGEKLHGDGTSLGFPPDAMAPPDAPARPPGLPDAPGGGGRPKPSPAATGPQIPVVVPPYEIVRDYAGVPIPHPRPDGYVGKIPGPPDLFKRDGWAFLIHRIGITKSNWLWLLWPPETVGDLYLHEQEPRVTKEEIRAWAAEAKHGDVYPVGDAIVVAFDMGIINAAASKCRSPYWTPGRLAKLAKPGK